MITTVEVGAAGTQLNTARQKGLNVASMKLFMLQSWHPIWHRHLGLHTMLESEAAAAAAATFAVPSGPCTCQEGLLQSRRRTIHKDGGKGDGLDDDEEQQKLLLHLTDKAMHNSVICKTATAVVPLKCCTLLIGFDIKCMPLQPDKVSKQDSVSNGSYRTDLHPTFRYETRVQIIPLTENPTSTGTGLCVQQPELLRRRADDGPRWMFTK